MKNLWMDIPEDEMDILEVINKLLLAIYGRPWLMSDILYSQGVSRMEIKKIMECHFSAFLLRVLMNAGHRDSLAYIHVRLNQEARAKKYKGGNKTADKMRWEKACVAAAKQVLPKAGPWQPRVIEDRKPAALADLFEEKPVKELDLSSRAYGALRRGQISNTADLLRMYRWGKQELRQMRNVGDKITRETQEALLANRIVPGF